MKDQKIQPTKKRRVRKIKADTIVSVVLDMSGSMSGIASATREGLNAYINSLREDNDNTDEVLVSITVFDSDTDWSRGFGNQCHIPRIATRFELVPLSQIPEITVEHYRPEGGTPLYDAIGEVISRTESALKLVKGKPDVLLVIITDGGDNTSTKLTDKDAKLLIEKKQGQGWTPIYLGANHDAWAVSSSLGIAAGSTKSYNATVDGMRDEVFADLGVRTHAHRTVKKALYSNAMARGQSDLVGSYTCDAFFAGDTGDVEGIVEEYTSAASLGGVKPDESVEAPEFDIVTESFPPTKLKENEDKDKS